MKYDITTNKAPEMPNLGKGTECIKLLLSQASKDMHEPLVPMLFPSLAAHISGAEFQYPDRSWKETCGLMANLVGESGCNKGQLTDLTKAICRDFQQHIFLSLYLCFTIENTYLGSQCVEIVKAAVVRVRRHIADSTHRVELPRSQDE